MSGFNFNLFNRKGSRTGGNSDREASKCDFNHGEEITRLQGALQQVKSQYENTEALMLHKSQKIKEQEVLISQQEKQIEDQIRKQKNQESDLEYLKERTSKQQEKILEYEKLIAQIESQRRRDEERMEHEKRLAEMANLREQRREEFKKELDEAARKKEEWEMSQKKEDFELKKFQMETEHETAKLKQDVTFEAFQKFYGA